MCGGQRGLIKAQALAEPALWDGEPMDWRLVGITVFERSRGALMRLLPLAALVITLTACSMFDKEALAPDEPADKLYNEGLYLLNNKKDPKTAAKKFEEVDRQHPYSEWARKSLIMSAYAYYESAQYDDCINSARRYVTLHPGSPDAAYAQFLIGSSYFDQMPDITRDQGRTEKAVEALDEVVRRYPNVGIRGCRQAKDRGRARPAGRQRDGVRALAAGAPRVHRGHQPFQGRGDPISTNAACRGSAAAAHRGLYGAWHRG